MIWDTNKQVGKKIIIKTKKGFLSFEMERIKYIICDGHYCYIVLADNSEHRVRRSLKYFEKTEKLEDFGFAHVNRNTLVNCRYVFDAELLQTKRTLHLKVINNESIIVSRRKVHLFKDIV